MMPGPKIARRVKKCVRKLRRDDESFAGIVPNAPVIASLSWFFAISFLLSDSVDDSLEKRTDRTGHEKVSDARPPPPSVVLCSPDSRPDE
jgi:hypothetical protein